MLLVRAGLLLLAVCWLSEPGEAARTNLRVFLSRVRGPVQAKDLEESGQRRVLSLLKDDVLQQAAAAGHAAVRAFSERQRKLRRGLRMNRLTPAFIHARFMGRRHQRLPQSNLQSIKCSIFLTAALRELRLLLALSAKENRWLAGLRLYRPPRRTATEVEALRILRAKGSPCRPRGDNNVACDPVAPFRTIDGRCNNLENPEFGTSDRVLDRFLEPAYADGIGEPRVESVDGSLLPNPRTISLNIHERSSDETDTDDSITHMVMQWGQLMDHDLTLVPVVEQEPEEEGGESEPAVCCAEDIQESEGVVLSIEELQARNEEEFFTSELCSSFPLDPVNDPVFAGRTCHPIVRSLADGDGSENPSMTTREQVNVVTAFVDGSQVYGSTNEEAEALRAFRGGLLLTNDSFTGLPPGDILPPTQDPDLPCVLSDEVECFVAGDERVTEHPGLATVHTLLLREHNRIARALRRKYPRASDELLYQNTRRIVSAEIQVITYGEFLPVLINKERLTEFNLDILEEGFFEGYDDTVDAAIRNEFASAAFRIGHTFIRSNFSRLNGGQHFSDLLLREHFERATEIVNPATDGLDSVMNGLITDEAQAYDRKATTEVADHLFELLGQALDLFSTNVARGREHGIQPYIQYRELCGLSVPANFSDLVDHDAVTQGLFAKTYGNVADIDLFPAAIAEATDGNGLVGPTFQCLVGRQFEIAKVGDRFYFESKVDSGLDNFNAAEVAELRKVTLSRMICDNIAGVSRIQPNAFRQPTFGTGNGVVNCDQIAPLDLAQFRFRS